MATNAWNTTTCMVYEGESDPNDFIRQYKIQALFHDWDEAKQVANIPLFLKKKASRVFKAINPQTTILQIFNGLITGCQQPQELSLYQFYERKRRTGESVSKFALALQELLLKALPEMNDTPELANKFLRPQLCLNLPPHMRAMVQFNSNLTWEQLLICLDKSLPHVVDLTNESNQQNLNESYSRWDSYSQSQAQTDNASFQQQQLIKTEPADAMYSHSQQRNNQQQSQYTQQNQFSQQQPYKPFVRFNGNCFYCNLVGHQEWECKWKLQNIRDGIRLKTNHKEPRQFSPRQNGPRTSTSRNTANINNTAGTEYSFFGEAAINTETSTIEIISLNYSDCEKLLKLNVGLKFLNGPTTQAAILIDGGSSRSFIAPKLLTATQMNICANSNFINPNICRRQKFDITGATGTTKSDCCIVQAEIDINGWSKKHDFIISGAVNKHEAILGRDFLKAHGILVDHENDALVHKVDGIICSRGLDTFNTFIFQSDNQNDMSNLLINDNDELKAKLEMLQIQVSELEKLKSSNTEELD